MFRICTVALALGALVLAGSRSVAADGMLGVELVERGGQVIIVKVMPNTPAANLPLLPGDVLLKVGTTNISSIQDALDAKTAANNNEDIPFIFDTPGGVWPVNARFEKGTPYGKYSATKPRPRKK